MKRSILFWPVAVGAAVFLLWALFCLFVIGVPRPGNTSGTYPSPAYHVLTRPQCVALAQALMSLTNCLWRWVPYCRPAGRDAAWERVDAPVGVQVDFIQEGRSFVYVRPQADASRYLSIIPSIIRVWALSPREVLAYVIVLPGAHFALAAFILAGVGTVLARFFMRSIPEGPAPPPGGQEEGERTR